MALFPPAVIDAASIRKSHNLAGSICRMAVAEPMTGKYCRAQIGRLLDAIEEAERDAGIAEAGRSARESSFPVVSIREAYFRVADLSLRRRLMWHIREIDRYKRYEAQAELQAARSALSEAQKPRRMFALGAGAFAILVVYVGDRIGGRC